MDDDVAATKRVSIGGVILTVDLLVYQVTEIMLITVATSDII